MNVDTTQLLKDSLKFQKTFCVYPFLHEHKNTSKKRLLCCHSNSKNELSKNDLSKIRNHMLENKMITECAGCYKLESDKEISPRQKANKEWKKHLNLLDKAIHDHLNKKTIKPVWYDLRTSNLCNLECQMCNAKASSSIAKRQGINRPFLTWDTDSNINPKSVKVYLAGGEPFLIKSFSDRLNKITNTDCEIVINTNCTTLTSYMLEALDRFHDINFTCSIDGYDKLNNLIRINSNFEDIDKNIDILAERYPSASFHVNTVVQKDNINYLQDLAQWIHNKKIISLWTLSILTKPEYFHYSNAPSIDIPELIFDYPLIKNNPANVYTLKNIKSCA